MCCNTNKCCCGCFSVRIGIAVAGVIDTIILLAAVATISVVVGLHGGLLFMIYVAETNYIFVVLIMTSWFAILLTSDILLVVGALSSNTGLMMVWLITGMINIVFLLVGWTSIFLFFAYSSCNECWDLLLSVFTGDSETDLADDEAGFYQLAIIMWMSYTLMIIIPIYYIYIWVMVKSHLENLVRTQTVIEPIA